ncbi:MAG: beta-ketoacyl-ACP synthase II [Calditrichaeota bacterium]|nr:beta-ketoacyl-ACP synthase II [Calditrichota bacterium]MCB0294346.1 beta-ketoacyl-ACP synthase II [Calditrichota bacterium]MCB0302254.1 beta-ketoacyl-ACP synthase II [Calditrichota bacterium]MCB0312608.1 beta-ketoacyl-ACP synthase II [Calditrichota bacterium]MCB9087725.1 beta-ketoacyl-ACP synthase II [Calditrichia bacterium]
MNHRRVVVTGMGVVTAIGNNVKDFWEGLLEGRNGVADITHFDASQHSTRFGAEVKHFSVEGILTPLETRRMDVYTQYAMVAADEAVRHSGLDLEKINLDRAGVVVGSGIGGILSFEQEHAKFVAHGPRRVSPYFVPQMISDIAAGQISIRYRLRGPNYATVSACATASHAIGDAVRLIKYGDADVMVTGGSEAPITPMGVAGFCSMKALSQRNDDPTHASRPFERDRDGFVIGEGAGILVLEELEHARKRGATIYAEVCGVGFTADAHHVTAPAPGGEGAVRAMRRAVEDAGLNLDEVDYINAHGTSTPYNDKNESAAIKTLFGDHAYRLNVSSTKSMVGHLLGAAGGVEAVAAALAVKHDVVPPTINYENPDPECDLNYTPNAAQERTVNAAISNTFGFGGHNACLAVRKYV